MEVFPLIIYLHMETCSPKSKLQKWHHLHNSFLLGEEGHVIAPLSPSYIQRLLAPDHLDGLVIFRKHNNGPKALEMKAFFNNDGSSAKYCGNAHICLATIGYRQGIPETKFGRFIIKTTSTDTFTLTPFNWQRSPTRSLSFPHIKQVTQITFGVPHIVILENVSARQDILNYNTYSCDVLLEIQNHKTFPEGTNITFVFLNAQGRPQGSVSFERGLKKFSNACSSGIFASLIVCLQHDLIRPEEMFSWETQLDTVKLKVTKNALVIYSKAYPIGD